MSEAANDEIKESKEKYKRYFFYYMEIKQDLVLGLESWKEQSMLVETNGR